MTTKEMTPAQFRNAVFQTVIREFGASGLIRFVQDYSEGVGDYTKDRASWLPPKSVRELEEDISAWRRSKSG